MFYADEPTIDRATLDRNTMGNRALQHELFMIYFEQAPVYLGQLAAALEANDAIAWRDAAHGLKGASRSLGLLRLAALARQCEETAPAAAAIETLREAVAEAERSAAREQAA